MAKSNPVLEAQTDAPVIPLQETSKEIWDTKYRLKTKDGQPIDQDVDGTYQRVARALAEQEQEPEKWYEPFLWALRNGAIPAGRITSNAGAFEHKPRITSYNVCYTKLLRAPHPGAAGLSARLPLRG